MKTFLLIAVLIICTVCFAYAAPAENPQSVQFLKYSNDQELEELQRQIIAQYDNLGGTSQFHQVQSAAYVDPDNLKLNFS